MAMRRHHGNKFCPAAQRRVKESEAILPGHDIEMIWTLFSDIHALEQTRTFFLQQITAWYGLTPRQLQVVGNREPLSLRRLAAQLGENEGNTSRMCQLLAQGGYLEITSSADDRRSRHIRTTDKTRYILMDFKRELQRQLQRIQQQHPEIEQNKLFPQMHQFALYFEEQRRQYPYTKKMSPRRRGGEK